MIRLLAVLFALVPTSYVDEVAAAWTDDPVYVSEDTGALSAEDADLLRERIDGWRDDVHVAVVPALALQEMPGSSDPARAAVFLQRVHQALGEDGVYVVAFGGIGTYGAAFGTDDRIGSIVAAQVESHTLGQLDLVLGGILDDLGAPGGEKEEELGWGWVGLAVVALLLSVGLLLLRRRRSRPGFGGPAPFRPSFGVQPDEHDTVEERAALAREDVTRLGEELDRADLPTTDPAVAVHVQAALDAYYDAARRVDSLTTDAELRQLGEITDYARWQADCARARLEGAALPPRRAACFLDPDHGLSVADWNWTPPGGAERPVPLCRQCLERISSGSTA